MNNPLALSSVNPVLRWLLHRVTRLNVLSGWYEDWLRIMPGDSRNALSFLDYTLGKLDVSLRLGNPQRLRELPASGPLLLLANHPLGGLEGMLLSRLFLQQRPDLKVLVNDVLLTFPEFGELFIGVDVLHPGKQRANARGMKQASQHLAAGGALLVFPAGTVANFNWKLGVVEDAPWQNMVGRLALRHKACCVPVLVEARNPRWFYAAGLVHKRLRTLLLPRAMLARRHAVITAVIGQTLDCSQIDVPATPAGLMQYLRVSCELLGTPQSTQAAPLTFPELPADLPTARLQRQMLALESFCVARHADHAVYCAPYAELGCFAEQLAIERERSFRAAGEGTGLSTDSDQFDTHYWHVWAWDHVAAKLIGGYRVAAVDGVIRQHGVNGLYSHSLFNYDQDFIQALGGAIEVGRSFVSAGYQRNPRALDLLWRGIGAFVVQHPQCHTLFGCVSISRLYSPLARALMADTLLSNHRVAGNICALVKPASPLHFPAKSWNRELLAVLSNIAIINKLLGHADAAQRVPVLIRHYLALNGKFVDFSLNHGFNEALDGLIVVDLRQAPFKYLDRYLGKSESLAFISRWQVQHVA